MKVRYRHFWEVITPSKRRVDLAIELLVYLMKKGARFDLALTYCGYNEERITQGSDYTKIDHRFYKVPPDTIQLIYDDYTRSINSRYKNRKQYYEGMRRYLLLKCKRDLGVDLVSDSPPEMVWDLLVEKGII